MLRIIAAALVAVLALTAPAQAANSDLTEAVAKVLKENPDIILDALRENDQELYSILEVAAETKRRKDARAEQIKQLKKPFKPAIDPKRILHGNPDAEVTIVEYSDFQCPYCKRMSEAVDEALKELDGKVRFIFKNYPLRNHKSASLAAYLFEAVALQSKDVAWKFYHKLFENQEKLDDLGNEGIRNLAAEAGADLAKLDQDLRNDIIRQRMAADAAEFKEFGFKGVPVLMMNGIVVPGLVTKQDILDTYILVTKGPQALPGYEAEKGGLVDEESPEDCMECLEEPEAAN